MGGSKKHQRSRLALIELARPLRGKKQWKVLVDARRRCAWLATRPEKFPELFGQLRLWNQRRARFYRKRCEDFAKIMMVSCYRYDLVTSRIGRIRPDGKCEGLSEKQYSAWTGIAGIRTVKRVLSALYDAGYLTGRKARRRAGNPRARRVKKDGTPAPAASATKSRGHYISYPTVRRVTELFFERLELDELLATQRAEASARQTQTGRIATVTPIDFRARRERERRIYATQQQRTALAAKQARHKEPSTKG